MRIIPVIDLKSGLVVRGVAGRRDDYRPVDSVLAADASPVAVAEAFVQKCGFRELYLADLDAIAGAPPAWEICGQLLQQDVELCVDAGIGDISRARELAAYTDDGRRLSGIIAGLESLPRPEMLPELVEVIGPQRLIFSLDLKAQRPLTSIPAWQDLRPQQIAAEAIGCGIRRMIVLDLAQVGMRQGAAVEPLCAEIRKLDPNLDLITGGGVRHMADLQAIARSGCDAVLVASALHDGHLTAEEVRPLESSL